MKILKRTRHRRGMHNPQYHSDNERRRILVVEDNGAIARTMQLLLQREGYETRWCQDESLYSLLEEWKLDLILMDLRMPRLDGETATQAIKSNPATSSIPIILVTAEQVSKERLKVISANEMLPKPFRVPLLLERVRYWISRYRRGEDQGSSLDRGLSPAI